MMTGRKVVRLLLWFAIAVVVLAIVAYAAIVILLPKDRIIAMVIPEIEEALNRKVTVGDVSVSIRGGIGLRLSDLAVKNPDGFKSSDFVELDDLDVKVRFFPLFKKRVEITRFSLSGLRMRLEKTEAGLTNYGDIGGRPGESVEEIKPEQAAAALPFSFEDLRIDKSSVQYVDDSSGTEVVLAGISLTSTLVPEGSRAVLRSRGKVAVDDVSYSDLKSQYRFASLKLGLTHDLLLDIGGDSLKIDRLGFSTGKLKGNLGGVVTGMSGETHLDLNFRTDDLSLAEVLAAIPRDLLAQADDLTGSGVLHLVAEYHGPAQLTRQADIQGKLTMKNIALAHQDFSGKMQMELAELNFSETSLTFFTGQAELAGEPFSLKIIVDNLPDPNLSAEANIDLNLKAVKQFLQPDQDLSGRMTLHATAYGKLKAPESMSLLGSLKLRETKYSSRDLGYSVENVRADVEFIGKDVRIEDFRADLGESDVAIRGGIKHFAPYIVAPSRAKKKPLFTGTVTSNYLNLDQLYAEEDASAAGEGAVPDTSVLPLPDFDAEGTFHVKGGVYSLVAFENARGKFQLTDYILHIDSVTTEIYDGDVTGSAVVDIENLGMPEFRIDYRAKGIEVNSFLSRFTGFADHLFGDINMSGSFAGTGSEIEDILPGLSASGSWEMRKGKLVNFDLVKKLAEPLGYKTFDEESVRDLAGTYRVENGRVHFDDLNLTTSAGNWELSGSVGFDGSLDYAGKIVLSADAAKDLDFLGDLKKLLQGDGGRIVLPFRLGGTYSSPQVQLDTSSLRDNVDNTLKDEGKKLLDKLFRK